MAVARAFVVELPYQVCGRAAIHVELRREGDGWRFIYEGIAAGNGNGTFNSDEEVALLAAAFTDPPISIVSAEQISITTMRATAKSAGSPTATHTGT